MEWLLPLMIIALFAMMLMQLLRQRKQVKEIQKLQDEIGPGARIMTTAGLHAQVHSITDDTVELEIAPGVVTIWDRRVIRERVDTTPPAAAVEPNTTEPDAS